MLEGGQFIAGGYGVFNLRPPDSTGECRYIYFFSSVTSDRYPNDVWNPSQDEVLAFAQVGGFLSPVFGIILLVNIFKRQFGQELKWYKLILFLTATGIQVSLGWIWLIWFSQGCDFFTCSYASGSTFVILSHLCWLGASWATRYIRPSKKDRKDFAMSNYSPQLRLKIKERENRYEMEYLPLTVSMLIMGLLIYLALHNINET